MATALKTEVDSLLQHGAYDEALPKLSVLLMTQPENAELYYQRATCHLALGNMKEAISEIDKAINLKADKRYRDLKNKTIRLAKKKEIRRLTARAKQHLRVGIAATNRYEFVRDTRSHFLETGSRIFSEEFRAP